MSNITEQLERLAQELDALLPYGHCVQMNIRRYASPPDLCIDIHGVKSYKAATGIFRALGIQKRNKTPCADGELRTVLEGNLSETIHVTVYCAGLPPSCRVVKFKERIPKAQTVETSEFIEVERIKVVCGNEKPEPQPLFAESAA